MRTVIITEGITDQLLLKNVFREYPDLEILVAGGYSSTLGLASSVLSNRDARVIVVADADSNDPAAIAERRDFIFSYLRRTTHNQDLAVVLFEPQIEAVLFQDPSVIKELTGEEFSPGELIEGKYQPKRVLEKRFGRLSTQTIQKLFGSISPSAVEKLRQLPPFQQINSYLQELPQAA